MLIVCMIYIKLNTIVVYIQDDFSYLEHVSSITEFAHRQSLLILIKYLCPGWMLRWFLLAFGWL